MAGEVLSRGLEERLSNQIGKQTFISNLLPPAQPAPVFKEGESKNQIPKSNSVQNQIKSNKNTNSEYSNLPNVSTKIQNVQNSGTPDWFLPEIERILKTAIPTPGHPTLRFELTMDAAVHNMQQSKLCNNSIHEYLLIQKGTFVSFGSEFRPPEVLHPLFMPPPELAGSAKHATQGLQVAYSTYQRSRKISKKQRADSKR
jgi:hypothetical protein